MKSEQPTHLPPAQVDVLVQLRIAMCASVYHGAHLLRVLSFVFLPRAIGENRAPPCASPTNDRNKCGGRARGGTHVTRPERRLWFSAAASSPVILLFPMDPTSFSTQSTYFWGTEDEESLWSIVDLFRKIAVAEMARRVEADMHAHAHFGNRRREISLHPKSATTRRKMNGRGAAAIPTNSLFI